MMTKHWALAILLGAIGAPSAAVAAGADDTSGTDRTRSAYEQAVKLVEAADYEDAIQVLAKLTRKESGNADVLNMLGFAHRKLGRAETAFDYYRKALAIEPRHLGAVRHCLPGRWFVEIRPGRYECLWHLSRM